MNLPRSVILQLAAAGVTWGSEKVQSKFIEQQSHKHNGNIFLNTHQGLTANEVLEIIADNLSEAGWSWGCLSAVDREGRIIWIVDAHRDDGKRFIARSDEKLTAFLELEAAIRRATDGLARAQARRNYCFTKIC